MEWGAAVREVGNDSEEISWVAFEMSWRITLYFLADCKVVSFPLRFPSARTQRMKLVPTKRHITQDPTRIHSSMCSAASTNSFVLYFVLRRSRAIGSNSKTNTKAKSDSFAVSKINSPPKQTDRRKCLSVYRCASPSMRVLRFLLRKSQVCVCAQRIGRASRSGRESRPVPIRYRFDFLLVGVNESYGREKENERTSWGNCCKLEFIHSNFLAFWLRSQRFSCFEFGYSWKIFRTIAVLRLIYLFSSHLKRKYSSNTSNPFDGRPKCAAAPLFVRLSAINWKRKQICSCFVLW